MKKNYRCRLGKKAVHVDDALLFKAFVVPSLPDICPLQS